MSGTLVLCSTPIGNLGDTTKRLADALRGADVVYAEDTRRAGILLDALGVQATVRSYFIGNEQARSAEVGERIGAGETVALVTDAGTPGVADPGVSAVRAARAAGGTITAVPGPSAVTMALAVSGFGADRFVFEGFLPRKGGERRGRIDRLAAEDRTVVFFTTGQRVVKDLADLGGACDPGRQVVVARELTKAFEEVWCGSLGGAPAHWADAVRKGEFTVVLEAGSPPDVSLEDAVERVRRLVADGEKLTIAAKQVAKETGFPRSELYGIVVERSSDEQD